MLKKITVASDRMMNTPRATGRLAPFKRRLVDVLAVGIPILTLSSSDWFQYLDDKAGLSLLDKGFKTKNHPISIEVISVREKSYYFTGTSTKERYITSFLVNSTA